MACRGGHERSSTHHNHQEDDVEGIIKSLDDIQKRICNLRLLYGDVHELDALHLKDVITTKHALKHQGEYAPVKLRIASWNLKKATMKGKYPEKIGMINESIGHINPDIVALQEIASSPPSDLLEKICDELVEPWVFATAQVDAHEHSAFLWKKCGELQMKKTSPENLDFCRMVQTMEIQIGPFEFTLLNFHFAPRFKYDDVRRKKNDVELYQLKNVSRHFIKEKFPPKNLILIGDFNTYPLDDDLNKRLRFENIFKPQEYTNVSKNQCYDNIIVHQKLKLCCTSRSVQDIIVNGDIATADQLEYKFDHLPICAEFEIPRKLNLMPLYDGYRL